MSNDFKWTNKGLAHALSVPLLVAGQLCATAAIAASDPPLDVTGILTNNYQFWEPEAAGWGSGNASGYAEGDDIAFSIEMSGPAAGGGPGSKAAWDTRYIVTICMEYGNVATTPTQYAFIGRGSAWNTFTNPPPVERAAPYNAALTSELNGVYIDWGTVVSVSYLGLGQSTCDANELSYDIVFDTPVQTSPFDAGPTNFLLYFSGTISREGLVSDQGHTIGSGESVSNWPTGNFQSTVGRGTGKKTVNFSRSEIGISLLITKAVDTDGDGLADLTGGTDSDTALSGHVITVCPSGTTPPDASCLEQTMPEGGQLNFAIDTSNQGIGSDLDIYESTVAGAYQFVEWVSGGDCVDAGSNNMSTVTSIQPSSACTVLNQAPPTNICCSVHTVSSGVVNPPDSVLFGGGQLDLTFNSGTGNYDATLDTSTGIYAGRGFILNDGQFPVSAGCTADTEECLGTSNAWSTPAAGFTSCAALNLSSGTPLQLSGGGSISFDSASSYSYAGGKFAGHGGTYKVQACGTVPEPSTWLLMLAPLAGMGLLRRRKGRKA